MYKNKALIEHITVTFTSDPVAEVCMQHMRGPYKSNKHNYCTFGIHFTVGFDAI